MQTGLIIEKFIKENIASLRSTFPKCDVLNELDETISLFKEYYKYSPAYKSPYTRRPFDVEKITKFAGKLNSKDMEVFDVVCDMIRQKQAESVE